ncbi:MAG: DUF4159 domain-containing protein [Ignavibacteriales bacterium]|nr:DUF4159 domain-containing protein [Ignavibacteriales bacterium]
MKKLSFIIILGLLFGGCDAVYRYLVLPDVRQEYAIFPDATALAALNDTAYSVSQDGMSLIYNAKNWKIEIRYMSDYQLNNFEFPEESKLGEFSGNPYTFGNWIDPKLGITPVRFSVFKVSIFNYTGTKLNYNPEGTTMFTNRGDELRAYAREKKNAKSMSMEEYFTKRKGKSGVEDDVFETRMGIVRRTMLYYGKPVYKGDSREGLVVFDPVDESVQNIKIEIKDFVLAYNENNEPTEFRDLVYHCTQKEITDVKYNSLQGKVRWEQPWNPYPQSVPNLVAHAQRNTQLKLKFIQGSFDDAFQVKAPIAMLFGNGLVPEFSPTFVSASAEFISNGGVIYIDNCYVKEGNNFRPTMDEYLSSLQKKLVGKMEYKRIEDTHAIYNQPNKLNELPNGYDELLPERERAYFLKGIFFNGKLAVIYSSKGYPVHWAEDFTEANTKQLDFGVNILTYALKTKQEFKK